MVFAFVFLTTMVFPGSEGNGKLARAYALVQPDSGLPPGRFKTIMVSRNGESNGPGYAVHGHR
jgi:hypothetical protein